MGILSTTRLNMDHSAKATAQTLFRQTIAEMLKGEGVNPNIPKDLDGRLLVMPIDDICNVWMKWGSTKQIQRLFQAKSSYLRFIDRKSAFLRQHQALFGRSLWNAAFREAKNKAEGKVSMLAIMEELSEMGASDDQMIRGSCKPQWACTKNVKSIAEQYKNVKSIAKQKDKRRQEAKKRSQGNRKKTLDKFRRDSHAGVLAFVANASRHEVAPVPLISAADVPPYLPPVVAPPEIAIERLQASPRVVVRGMVRCSCPLCAPH